MILENDYTPVDEARIRARNFVLYLQHSGFVEDLSEDMEEHLKRKLSALIVAIVREDRSKYGRPIVELDAVQREGLAYRAWRQVGIGGSAFQTS